jgi:hypothetical protein
VHRLTLGVLTPAESVAVLSRMLGADRVNREPEAAAELARVCGGLPLALRIAAANLTDRPARSIARHVAALRTDDRLSELAVDDDPQIAVRVAFVQSYARAGPGVRRMFRELGLAPGADLSPPAAAAPGGTWTRRWACTGRSAIGSARRTSWAPWPRCTATRADLTRRSTWHGPR